MAGEDVEGLYAALAKSGWLENALRLNGIYNVLVQVKVPVKLQDQETEHWLCGLGAREVRVLGEVLGS